MKSIISKPYVLDFLKTLLQIPSPSGYCSAIVRRLVDEASRLGIGYEITPKETLILTVPGSGSRVLGLAAHVDTLGAMVRSINPSGTLRITPVGGYAMNSIEGEYCLVHTRDGRTYSGTILTTHSSVHVYDDARTQKREEANMEVRLDEWVRSREETKALGIRTGDYVTFDPRTVLTPNGWIKSRHLDNKAGTACLFGMLEAMQRTGLRPVPTLKLIISTYEEVGHGASYIPPEIDELLAIDMGAIGEDLACTEKDVSICAKDSTGPYDYTMTSHLIGLAERHQLDYAVDIYPHYGSDASAALRGGNNIRAALIGPGVHASHGLERTHEEALWNTIALLLAYVREPAPMPG